MSMGPPTVLLGWENGDGFAHLQRLRQIGDALQQKGFHTLMAVHDLKRAAQIIDPERHPLVQCPIPPKSAWQYRSKQFQCMADILMAAGFCDPDAIRSMSLGWHQLFAMANISLVISDFSPSLNVAAANRLPCLCIGDGFTLPRVKNGSIADFDGQFSSHGSHRFHFVAEKLQPLADVLAEDPLHRMLYGDQAFCITYPLLDHQRAPELRPTLAPLSLPNNRINEHGRPHRQQVLVYLSADDPTIHMLLAALTAAALPVLAFIRDCPQDLRDHFSSDRLRIANEPLLLIEELQRSVCLIHHGGLGTTEQALWCGTPQLIAPRHVEQQLNGEAIRRQGCGLVLKASERNQRDAIQAALTGIIQEPGFIDTAEQVARQLQRQHAAGSLSVIVEACIKA